MADRKKENNSAETAGGRKSQPETLKKVFRYLGRYRIYVVFSILLAAVSVALTLYVPKLTGHAVDYIIAVSYTHLVQTEATDIIPAENLVLREHIIVADDFFICHAHLLIHIIRDHHINLGICFHKPLHSLKDLEQGVLIHPVITVHDFEVFPRSVLEAAVDGVPVSAVFFLDGFDNAGIFFLVTLRDFLGPILGTVVDYDDLYIIAARQD